MTEVLAALRVASARLGKLHIQGQRAVILAVPAAAAVPVRSQLVTAHLTRREPVDDVLRAVRLDGEESLRGCSVLRHRVFWKQRRQQWQRQHAAAEALQEQAASNSVVFHAFPREITARPPRAAGNWG